ncbi:MAG: RibD family protein [Chloroflexi bacterium]|nr:RibD family protein [Chloroflexota bacterium]
MLPYTVIHNAVSLDGRLDWFSPDIGLYYELASRWREDATLAGGDTLLKAYAAQPVPEAPARPVDPPPAKDGDCHPLLVAPDSRARLRNYWDLLRREPYWRDVVVLCSRRTPADYAAFLSARRIGCIVEGDDRVDLGKALERLNADYGVKRVRVDSGGTLNGVLLRAGLVNEVSVLVHPCLVGGVTPQSLFRAPDLTSAAGVINLKLTNLEKLKDGIVWLRYEVVR